MLSSNILKQAENLNPPDPMGSYAPDDVTFVLKDISNLIKEQGNEEREQLIQSGIHYSQMLPIEYQPTQQYLDVFHQTLETTSQKIADAVSKVATQIVKNRGTDIVLVSLARAGTPIGVLLKRYIEFGYGMNVKHYSISIIRDIGIDENALLWIIKKHPGSQIQFIDGWTGKGVINSVLEDACAKFHQKYGYSLDSDLAVLSDPAYCVSTFGTREDFLIPSACLNSTVSGLVSRTVYRKDLIGPYDFHGAKYYKEWMESDLSNYFIDKISSCFKVVKEEESPSIPAPIINIGLRNVIRIQKDFGISNINLIKPGVGETTRVLLRRVPWKILVDRLDNPNLKHILLLAQDRKVLVEVYKEMSFSACGIIKPKTSNAGGIQ